MLESTMKLKGIAINEQGRSGKYVNMKAKEEITIL